MHKLMEFVCNELEDLERKAEKDGKLSMAEVQYADTLAHMKKNLLKSEEMVEESEYSMDDGSYNSYGRSYARGGNRGRSYSRNSYARRRDSMGRYSRGYSMDGDELVDELRELMQDAPDEKTRMEFEKFIRRVESM